MALTFSNLKHEYVGTQLKVSGTVTFASGGGTVTAAALGLGILDSFRADPAAGYVPQYTPSTGALIALFADYDGAADGVLIEDSSAGFAAPFEAYGVG